MPFSRKGVPYAMSARAYYPNLVVVSVLLLGSVILNSVAQGADVSVQLQAAGSYALPVTLYLFAALIGLIFVRRSGLTLPAAVPSAPAARRRSAPPRPRRAGAERPRRARASRARRAQASINLAPGPSCGYH